MLKYKVPSPGLVTNCPRVRSSPIYVSGEKDIWFEVKIGIICNQFFKITFAIFQRSNSKNYTWFLFSKLKWSHPQSWYVSNKFTWYAILDFTSCQGEKASRVKKRERSDNGPHSHHSTLFSKTG